MKKDISLKFFLSAYFVFYSFFFILLSFLLSFDRTSQIITLAVYALAGFGFYLLLSKKLLQTGLEILLKNSTAQYKEYNLKLRHRLKGALELKSLARILNGFNAEVHSTLYDLLNVIRHNKEIASHIMQSAEKYNYVALKILDRMDKIAYSSAELTDELGRAEENTEQIKKETDQIVAEINGQAAAVSQTSSAVEELIASINNITKVLNEREIFASEVFKLKKTAEEKFNQFTISLNRINSTIGAIGDSINIIRTIAEQSSILAINASIEAANAGIHGKSFAIVARELKALAENTQNNSVSIIANLKNIFKEFGSAQSAVESASWVFKNFGGAVDSFIEGINSVASGLNEMNLGTKEILEALETLNSVSQHVAGSANKINEALNIYKEGIVRLWKLGAANEEYAKKSAEETAGISLDVAQLSFLGEQNLHMLEKMEGSMQKIQMMDLSALKASDGQPLLIWSWEDPQIPERPASPLSYPETDRRRWWDYEYAGWGIEKLKQPESPLDGPEGKRIAYLFNTFEEENNTYKNALVRGAGKIAELYGMELTCYYANLKVENQSKQVEEVLKSRFDLVIIEPTEAKAGFEYVKRFYQAKIPVIVSLMAIEPEAYKYILSYTGPDDWGQTRVLAQKFAELMGKKNGYCIIQHVPGSGTDYGRTYGALTELKEFAPEMIFLEKAFTKFETELSEKTVLDWIQKYGERIKGIIMADDNYLLRGVIQAIEKTGRRDIVLAAAGNSKTGMDLVKEGVVKVITYQSAESTAALPMVTAAEFFEGLPIKPIKRLPIRLITCENVDEFYPPQF